MAGREVRLMSFRDRAKPPDVALATRQLATLIRSGVPLVESLTAIVEQTPKAELRKALVAVRDQVNEGVSLADGMRAHPRLFLDYFVNMVHAGEQSGTLEMVLDRLADFTEGQGRMRSKIVAALAYPAIMAILGTIIVGILMVVVVPQVTSIFKDFGRDLPGYTELMIWLSYMVANWWWAGILGLFAFVFLFRAWRRSKGGRKIWDRLVLRLPIAGDIAMKVAVARFARTLATLLKSGVPVLRAMEITRNVMGNAELEEIVDGARRSVQEGCDRRSAQAQRALRPDRHAHDRRRRAKRAARGDARLRGRQLRAAGRDEAQRPHLAARTAHDRRHGRRLGHHRRVDHAAPAQALGVRAVKAACRRVSGASRKGRKEGARAWR